ncbi:histidine kinase sensor protein [Plesiocystis pacifica SIR-1]|uniref:histidine kinase n=1 Tax=Plesiocystis pacifica SIR-1 TaxID=391625 RepID=A6FXK8_9BACT|nr:ATP-binding protein [Plesiocystis pacifica]EDM81596.1 histidine kinase sensor protein [Plesiocystis pacifica SIR-1]
MKLKQFLDSLNNEQLIDRLNLALDGAELGIWDWDLRDDSVQFDRRWCQMLGLDAEQTAMELGTWESRVHPDDIAQCYADIQAHLAGETHSYENIHRMRHENGEWIYILDRGRISGWDEDGKAIRFTGTHFDCTATERAKRVIDQQRELLADMVRNLPTGVAMFDTRGTYLAASDAWLRLFDLGPDPTELTGRTPAALGAALPPQWFEAQVQALRGESLSGDEDLITLPDGSRRYFRWSMRPWQASSEDIGGILVTCEDVTAHTEARRSSESEARLAALGLMAGGVAHELNTPLQTLMVHAEMIADELDALGDREVDAELAVIERYNDAVIQTTDRIASIVEALRTVSRHHPGDPLMPVDPRELANQQLDLCGARFRAERVRLTIDGIGVGDATILARPADVSQVLINLLNNALDAVHGRADAWVQLSVSREGDTCTFCVVDSGTGIPSEHIDQLMTPFFTTKKLGEGSGLGLSLAKSLAERMGGELAYVASAPNTTFELRLSCSSGDSPQ